MLCGKCGAENDDRAYLCAQCGAAMEEVRRSELPAFQGSVPTYLVPAILVTLFCCQPFGIVSIVFAAIATSHSQFGQSSGGHRGVEQCENLVLGRLLVRAGHADPRAPFRPQRRGGRGASLLKPPPDSSSTRRGQEPVSLTLRHDHAC